MQFYLNIADIDDGRSSDVANAISMFLQKTRSLCLQAISFRLLHDEADFKRSVPGEKDAFKCNLSTECCADVLALHFKRKLHKIFVKLQMPIVQIRGIALRLLFNIPAQITTLHVVMCAETGRVLLQQLSHN